MIFSRDNGHHAPHEATSRLCTPHATQFLLDTNKRLENSNVSRNSFKTNNSANFYSIQIADSTRYKSIRRHVTEISFYNPAGAIFNRQPAQRSRTPGLANLTHSSLSSDPIFEDRNPRA
jgi:hypothetical protein